jgi:hypothetical protein
MKLLVDHRGRGIRLTDERFDHMQTHHPEMSGQLDRISETLSVPDMIVRSKIDASVELFYKHYVGSPVSDKFLCTVVKTSGNDHFIITAYYTDTVKRGEVLWEKK